MSNKKIKTPRPKKKSKRKSYIVLSQESYNSENKKTIKDNKK